MSIRSILIAVVLLTLASLVPAYGGELSYVYNRAANTMVLFLQDGQTHEEVCALVANTGLTPDFVEVAAMLGTSPTYTECK